MEIAIAILATYGTLGLMLSLYSWAAAAAWGVSERWYTHFRLGFTIASAVAVVALAAFCVMYGWYWAVGF